MAKKYVKTKGSISLKNQASTNLTTMKYYLMSVGMAIAKKTKDNSFK